MRWTVCAGDGDESTVVSFGGNPLEKHITTYFRKRFVVTNVTYTLDVDVTYDDGCVIYLNGVEIQRFGMPSGVCTEHTHCSFSFSAAVYLLLWSLFSRSPVRLFSADTLHRFSKITLSLVCSRFDSKRGTLFRSVLNRDAGVVVAQYTCHSLGG